MRDRRVKATLVGADGITSDEFASIGGPAVEGTLMTLPRAPRRRPEAADVVKKMRHKKIDPEAYTLYSYAAVEVIKQAAEQARSLDPRKVAEAIHTGMMFKTVIGEISYDKNGDITRPDYIMYVWKKQQDGKITYVDEQ
jgi:branched-chain amino acid transport system substrate-binding protein